MFDKGLVVVFVACVVVPCTGTVYVGECTTAYLLTEYRVLVEKLLSPFRVVALTSIFTLTA